MKPQLPKFDVTDMASLKAVHTGTANEEQQKRAMSWIIYTACSYLEPSYQVGGDDGRRATDFNEGRRFVGNSIIHVLQSVALPTTPNKKVKK